MEKCDRIKGLEAFNKKYSTNKKCLEKIKNIRWKNGFRCPRCNCNEAWDIAPFKCKCRNCGYQTSVTAGTIFHRTHLPMTKWFQAIYYLSVRRENATATELQNILDIGSNKTALSVFNKLVPMTYCTIGKRLTWHNNQLKGIVEIEESEIFFDHKGRAIIVIVESKHGSIGRIRIVENPKRQNPIALLKNLDHQLIDEKATVRIHSREISCPLAKRVSQDFKDWCQKKEEQKQKKTFKELRFVYCNMINAYKVKVTFNDILKNILGNNVPPAYNSKLKK